jgi:predicted HD phosphohydrolase
MEYTDRDYRAAGRYFATTHPDNFRSWSRDEGTRSLLAAGRYFEAADPDYFDTIASERR